VSRAGVAFTLFFGAIVIATGAVACRQVLGVSTDKPVLDGGTTSGDDGGDAAASGAFTVVNGLPEGEILTAIWGADKDHFVAVGTSAISYVYDTGTLTRLGSATPGRDYNAVWGLSATDVYAVGYAQNGGGYVEHFDGMMWNVIYTTPVGLYGIWGGKQGSQTFIQATGEKGLMYGWHTGDTWKQINQVPPNQDIDAGPYAPVLWSISGRSINDFSIAGDLDYFLHWEPKGGGLVYYEPTVETDTQFHFVWQAPGPTTSVFFGTNYRGLYWFTAPGTDTDASVLPADSPFALVELARDETTAAEQKRYIQGIWGTNEKVIAVGDAGRVLVFDNATATLTTLPPPTDESLGGVWGTSLDDVWIVGGRELILHGSIR
jgi:hypothetical protein